MKQLLIHKNTSKLGFTFIELIIVVVIIVILAAMAQPNIHHGSRAFARQKKCFANQRLILGALEMYNMDNNTMMETALPGGDFEYHEYLLIRDGYLGLIEPPESDCSYGFIDIVGTGSVFCKKHGTTEFKEYEKPIIPEYDQTQEKPFTYAYKEIKEKLKKEKEYKERIESVKKTLVSPITLGLLTIIVVGFSIIGVGKKKGKTT